MKQPITSVGSAGYDALESLSLLTVSSLSSALRDDVSQTFLPVLRHLLWPFVSTLLGRISAGHCIDLCRSKHQRDCRRGCVCMCMCYYLSA